MINISFMFKCLKSFLSIIAITAVIGLGADFMLTAAGIDPFSRIQRLKSVSAGIAHPVYHHDLKPNFDDVTMWGPMKYRLCTNEYGFKTSCAQKGRPAPKNFDLAFIGDSFTEATGMSYEDSFVGLYAASRPGLSVANLGVMSYSPSIYLKKIEYLLKKGFTFKHIVVFPDISDIQDEAVLYRIDRDKGVIVEKSKKIEDTYERPQAEKNVRKEPRKINVWEKHFKHAWFANLWIYEHLNKGEIRIQGRDYIYDRAYWTTDRNVGGFGDEGVDGGVRQALEAMHELKALLDGKNIKMSVGVYPWPSQLANDPPMHSGVTIWKDFCDRENCASFINANEPFYAELQRSTLRDVVDKYYIRGDLHFNQEGNRLIFEAIDKNLKP